MNKAVRIVGICLIVCLAAMSARGAGFVNGGFEDGTFNGWTPNQGLWYGPIGSYTYSSNEVNYSSIVAPGFDPILSGLGTNMPMVYSGNYSARVNAPVANYYFAQISQTAVWQSNHIFFAWSAVLEDPGHEHDAQPHFIINLYDETAGSNLYSTVIAADTGDFNVLGNWKYSGWQVVDLDIQAVGAVGHTLTLTCLGAGCAYSGHSGYVYLDGFGAVTPPSGCSITNLMTQASSLTGVNKKLLKLLTKDLQRLEKALNKGNSTLAQLYAQRCEQRLVQMSRTYGADTETIEAMINCLEQLTSVQEEDQKPT